MTVKFGRIGTSGQRKTEREPKGDRVIGMFSHVCPLERHQSSLNLSDFFFFYICVFLSVITPCHLPGDSSETLSGRAPLGFIECLPLRFTTVQNGTSTKESESWKIDYYALLIHLTIRK